MSINDTSETKSENLKEKEETNQEENSSPIEKPSKINIKKRKKVESNIFEYLSDIRFVPRTELTNTHRNIVDDHIESIST